MHYLLACLVRSKGREGIIILGTSFLALLGSIWWVESTRRFEKFVTIVEKQLQSWEEDLRLGVTEESNCHAVLTSSCSLMSLDAKNPIR